MLDLPQRAGFSFFFTPSRTSLSLFNFFFTFHLFCWHPLVCGFHSGRKNKKFEISEENQEESAGESERIPLIPHIPDEVQQSFLGPYIFKVKKFYSFPTSQDTEAASRHAGTHPQEVTSAERKH